MINATAITARIAMIHPHGVELLLLDGAAAGAIVVVVVDDEVVVDGSVVLVVSVVVVVGSSVVLDDSVVEGSVVTAIGRMTAACTTLDAPLVAAAPIATISTARTTTALRRARRTAKA